LARLIHQNTPGRFEEAFVEINCAAIAEGLLESELFGHERGAFTNAKTAKVGLLEPAAGGTLFLDEIGELGSARRSSCARSRRPRSAASGARALSLMSGSSRRRRNLEAQVTAGRFRLDLFHRLDVFHLTLPPLRERQRDILVLARWLLERIAQRLRGSAPRLSPDAERVLLAYDYPGNVRELRNVLERTLILEPGPEITASSLTLGKASRTEGRETESFFSVSLQDDGRPPTLAEMEKLYIERLLTYTDWNRAELARPLKVSYPTVAKKNRGLWNQGGRLIWVVRRRRSLAAPYDRVGRLLKGKRGLPETPPSWPEVLPPSWPCIVGGCLSAYGALAVRFAYGNGFLAETPLQIAA